VVTRADSAEAGARVTAALTSAWADLLAYFRRRVDVEDAADLLAETMVTAWRRRADLPVGAEGGRMWLFGIARNTLLHHHRGEVRRWRLADRVRTAIAAEPPVVAGSDSGAEVRDAIDRLPPDLAELVRLVHWDGFTLAEAAVLTGVPASTARGRYQRAKGALRDILAASEARRG
jgi:RNA polymerase sigma factor (sigma-70 family)